MESHYLLYYYYLLVIINVFHLIAKKKSNLKTCELVKVENEKAVGRHYHVVHECEKRLFQSAQRLNMFLSHYTDVMRNSCNYSLNTLF